MPSRTLELDGVDIRKAILDWVEKNYAGIRVQDVKLDAVPQEKRGPRGDWESSGYRFRAFITEKPGGA